MKKLIATVLAVLITFTSAPAGMVLGESTLPESAQWSSFRGNSNNNGVINAKTPKGAGFVKLKWAYPLKDSNEWQKGVSDPVIVNDRIYIAVGNELLAINKDKSLYKKITLADSIEYTCRIAYADGRIIVPILKGRLEALNAKTLERVWVTDPLPAKEIGSSENSVSYEHQAVSTLSIWEGYAYMFTTCADWTQSYAGTLMCVDISSGQVKWNYENNSAGYYWNGCVFYGENLYFVGDDGQFNVFNRLTGEKKDSIKVSENPIRSTPVISGKNIYFTTTGGKLVRVVLKDDGAVANWQSSEFAYSSTSTPAISGNDIFVGAATLKDGNYAGGLFVIDSDSLSVKKVVNASAEVKASPLVALSEGKRYVYYTVNNNTGGVYVYAPDSGKSGELMFTPDKGDMNYCMASVAADLNGTLYYTNDSGKLFALERQDLAKWVKLNSKSLKLSVGSSKKLSFKASEKSSALIWKSSDSKTVSVKNGKITAKKVGTAVVSVKLGSSVAKCKVNVVPQKPSKLSYKIKGKKLIVSFKKNKGAKYTQIFTKKTSENYKKIKTVKGFKAKLSLKKGVYKIKLRSYAKVNGKKYYSGYTKAKIIKIR